MKFFLASNVLAFVLIIFGYEYEIPSIINLAMFQLISTSIVNLTLFGIAYYLDIKEYEKVIINKLKYIFVNNSIGTINSIMLIMQGSFVFLPCTIIFGYLCLTYYICYVYAINMDY